MEFTGIKETCFYVRDLEQIRSFYHDVLGLEVINYEKGKHIFFRCGRSVLLCFNPDDSAIKESPPAHYGGGKQHFAFGVPNDSYNEVRETIIAKGISITSEITWRPGVKSFYFEDPAGNVLEVVPEQGLWD